jgi:hypothetical protein
MKRGKIIMISMVFVFLLVYLFIFVSSLTLSPSFNFLTGNTNNQTISNVKDVHLNISDTSPYDNLVLYYSFDTDDNVTAYDISKNKYNGVYVSSSATTTGVYGNGVLLNPTGSTGMIDFNSSNIVFQNGTNWTVSNWLKWSGSTENYVFYLGKKSVGSQALLLRDNNNNRFAFRDNSSTFNDFSVNSSDSIIGVWTLVTFVSENGNLSLYLNGNFNQTITMANNLFSPGALGLSYSTNLKTYNGSIDELMLFNQSLTAQQIKDIYNNQSVRFKNSGDVTLPISSLTSNYQNKSNLSISASLQQNQNTGAKVSLGYCENISLNCSDLNNFTFLPYQNYAGNQFIYPLNSTHLTSKFQFFANNSDGNSSFYTPYLFNSSFSYNIFSDFAFNSVLLTSLNPSTNSTMHNLTSSVSVVNDESYSYVYNYYKNDTLNRTTLLTEGLVAYYPFDNNFKDYFSTYDGNGVGVSSVNSSGLKEGSLYLNGTNSLSFTDKVVPNGQGVTFSAWIKSPDLGTYRTILFNGGVSSLTSGYLLRMEQDGKILFSSSKSTSGQGTFSVFSTTANYDNDQWHHVVATWDGSKTTNASKIYMDNILVGQTTALNVSSDFNISYNLSVGYGVAGQNFTGLIDELTIYNKSLSASEISEIYLADLEGKNVSSRYLTANDVWKLQVEALNSTSSLGKMNSSTITINEATALNLTFPKEKVVIQRNQSGIGKLNVYGTITGLLVDSINMTYLGNSSGTLVIPVTAGSFNTSVYLNQGEYTFNFSTDDGTLDSINEFGVGDVLIIAGQSNVLNNANNYNVTASPYMVTSLVNSVITNNCTVTPNQYTIVDLGTAKRWSEIGNNWSINQSVPVMVANFGVGGAGIDYLTNTCLPLNFNILRETTGGTMQVRSVYWYQGEADYSMTTAQYYSRLQTLSTDYFTNLTFPFGINFVPSQILGGVRVSPGLGVRQAVQNSWYNMANVYRGAVMYDIQSSTTQDLITSHPDGNGLTIFDKRQNGAYFNFLANLSKTPILKNAYYYNASRLVLDIDRNNLEISIWNYTNGTIPAGIRLDALNLTSANISSATIKDNFVIIDYASSVLVNNTNLTLCAVGLDCYNESVIRSSDSLIPVEIVWNTSLVTDTEYLCESVDEKLWYENACYSDLTTACSENGKVVSGDSCVVPVTEEQSSAGGSAPSKVVSLASIQSGETQTLAYGTKLIFSFKSENHTIWLRQINRDKAEITIDVYSEKQNLSLAVGETKEVDLDRDGKMDYRISLLKIYDGLVKVDLKIEEIKTESTTQPTNNETPEQTTTPDTKKNYSWIIYSVLAILILATGFIFWKKKK